MVGEKDLQDVTESLGDVNPVIRVLDIIIFVDANANDVGFFVEEIDASSD